MYTLFIHDDAQADLERLRRAYPRTTAQIVVLLQELQHDQYLLDALTADDFGDDRAERIQVKKWERLWKAGLDLWRLKPQALADSGIQIRIIYAYLPLKRHYYVLGIARRRELDYDDPNHPLTQRILLAYENIAL
jgi:hypothetical protein